MKNKNSETAVNLKIGVCGLCRLNKELQYSHIIPEFLYKDLYDSRHRAIQVGYASSEHAKVVQKGAREYLLCGDCESLLSKYEKYASKFLLEELSKQIRDHETEIMVKGAIYKDFKIFQMSLLWRAGVSTLELFEQVTLGPHQEKLRDLICREDPGNPTDYGCFMSYSVNSPYTEKSLTSPVKLLLDGHTIYRFHTGQLFWYFVVSSNAHNFRLAPAFLSREGDIQLFRDAFAPEDIFIRLVKAVKESRQK